VPGFRRVVVGFGRDSSSSLEFNGFWACRLLVELGLTKKLGLGVLATSISGFNFLPKVFLDIFWLRWCRNVWWEKELEAVWLVG
jgi:hypothetical protein